MTTYRLTYRENNEPTILGSFQTQEELDALIVVECGVVFNESAMSFDDQDRLIRSLKDWARSQWNPNADKSMTFHYPDSGTVGRWFITEY